MKQWLGSRLGANLWELYNSLLRNISIRIDHNLDILESNQAFSVRFRNIETGQEALVGNSYYFDGDVGSKFYVTSLSPNHFVLELRPHLQDNEYEYIIELLEENDDQSVITFSTGDSIDSLGFGVNYRFDFGDNSMSDWLSDSTTTHVYSKPGIYRVRTQASALGMDSFWSEPLIITAHDTSVLVPAPKPLIGDTEVQLGLSVSYKVNEYKEFYGLLEYQIDWGDGQISDWTLSSVLLSHVWIEEGSYSVKCQARLASGYKQLSTWSESLTVNVVSQQSMLDLVNAGQFVIDLSPHKTKTPVVTSPVVVNSLVEISVPEPVILPGESVEYKVSFGNGVVTNFSDRNVVTYSYPVEGNYKIKAMVRKKSLVNYQYEWQDYDWSDDVLVNAKTRVVTTPTKPVSVNGWTEVKCKLVGINTNSPDGELLANQMSYKWTSSITSCPGVGKFTIPYYLTSSPYLIYVDYNVTGDSELRIAEKEYTLLFDDNNPYAKPDVFIKQQVSGQVPVKFYQCITSVIPDSEGNDQDIVVSNFRLIVRS